MNDSLGLFAWFWSDAEKKFLDAITRTDRHSLKKQGFHEQFRVHRSCLLSTSCVSKDNEVMQFILRSVSQKRSDLWNDHRISKRSIASHDILITLTLYKLALLLSGAEFRSLDRIHFRAQPRYMVCKNALFRRTFEHWNWECVWNLVSGANTQSREYTYY